MKPLSVEVGKCQLNKIEVENRSQPAAHIGKQALLIAVKKTTAEKLTGWEFKFSYRPGNVWS